jgi:hypothetical protein
MTTKVALIILAAAGVFRVSVNAVLPERPAVEVAE